MSDPMTWGVPPSPVPAPDPAESLRRIEVHTTELVKWTKYLAGAVILLVIVLVIGLFG
jgi:hypothetical protein